MSLANTRRKQASGFQKGQSGNPRGRPMGSRNNATLACEALLEGQAEALTQKAVDMALSGDTVALKLCIDRIYPARKDRAVTFALPPITSPRDAADIAAAVAEAVAAGHVTPSEAAEIGKGHRSLRQGVSNGRTERSGRVRETDERRGTDARHHKWVRRKHPAATDNHRPALMCRSHRGTIYPTPNPQGREGCKCSRSAVTKQAAACPP